MTWDAVYIAAIVCAVALIPAVAMGAWLAWMTQRGHGLWTVLVVVVLAFAFATGIAAMVVNVWPTP